MTPIELQEPYQKRPVRCLEVWTCGDWRMKVYGISYQRPAPRPELIEAAKVLAQQRLPQPAMTPTRYGVGFIGVHDGRGGNFVFIDWWADENELHHHVYVSPAADPEALDYKTPGGLAACVWDLAVLAHERLAWVETVLANPAGPDLEAYLARQLDTEV